MIKALTSAAALLAACIVFMPSAHAAALTGSVSLTDRPWVCQGPVNLASVTVVIRTAQTDAIHLAAGCTGTIGRVTVIQYHGDGIKVGPGAHDLSIGGGSIRCLAHDVGKHQDGIQAMGGQRITFNGLSDLCSSANNSAFFVNEGAAGHQVPDTIVCVACTLEGGGFPVRIGRSVNSGVRSSRVCPGKFGSVRVSPGIAQNPVDVGTVLVASIAGVPLCASSGSTPPANPAGPAPATTTTQAPAAKAEGRHHRHRRHAG
ncbi:MAG TPA: hypothetical protein VGU02_11165 [Gaiellaceae bacterium]|nr:hypothetical protein [Gaiellaceae bacterium]